MGIDANDDEHDSVLEYFCRVVSSHARKLLNRKIELTQYTEYFSVDPGATTFRLSAIPVSTINGTSEGAWNDADWEYAASSAVSTSDYTVDDDSGIIYFTQNLLVSGFRALKVVYTGGLAETTEDLLASDYADLVHACERQVLFLFNTRKTVGATSTAAVGNTVTYTGDVDWLPGVKNVLLNYRRGA